jgi:hypothetical protein
MSLLPGGVTVDSPLAPTKTQVSGERNFIKIPDCTADFKQAAKLFEVSVCSDFFRNDVLSDDFGKFQMWPSSVNRDR